MAAKLSSAQRKILVDFLSIPTAPFAEHNVLAFIEKFCERRRNVTLKRDKVGNILVRVTVGRRKIKRPVCITAHLDHPGFVSDRQLGKRRVRAFWRGGVPPEYFVGSKVRFSVNGKWVKGTVESIETYKDEGKEKVDTAEIAVKGEVPPRSIGMWDFPDPAIRGDRIRARACDDMGGAAAMLCAIDQLVRTNKSCDAYFLFTRAEEVGFVGAIAACRLNTIPKKCVVVAMETSSERINAKIGDGPILRVGDRVSTFTHEASVYVERIARKLERDGGFVFQRKLMDGGMCESTAYCRLGYEATGMCVALGNYHNIDAKNKKLAPEYISVSDFAHTVKWFVELARAPEPYTGKDDATDKRLKSIEKRYRTLLRQTVDSPR